MAVETDPAYPRWSKANDRLMEAKKRYKDVVAQNLPEAVAAKHDLDKAQTEYDLAKTEIGSGDA
jgi:hypothetical protein